MDVALYCIVLEWDSWKAGMQMLAGLLGLLGYSTSRLVEVR